MEDNNISRAGTGNRECVIARAVTTRAPDATLGFSSPGLKIRYVPTQSTTGQCSGSARGSTIGSVEAV